MEYLQRFFFKTSIDSIDSIDSIESSDQMEKPDPNIQKYYKTRRNNSCVIIEFYDETTTRATIVPDKFKEKNKFPTAITMSSISFKDNDWIPIDSEEECRKCQQRYNDLLEYIAFRQN